MIGDAGEGPETRSHQTAGRRTSEKTSPIDLPQNFAYVAPTGSLAAIDSARTDGTCTALGRKKKGVCARGRVGVWVCGCVGVWVCGHRGIRDPFRPKTLPSLLPAFHPYIHPFVHCTQRLIIIELRGSFTREPLGSLQLTSFMPSLIPFFPLHIVHRN